MRHSLFTVLFFGLAALVVMLNAQYYDDVSEEAKRGGGRAFLNEKRGGARAFLTEAKRGGARAFQMDFGSEDKRGGARAFQLKRGGARAFQMKRGGARAFLENKRDEDWVIQPFANEDRLEKRGGGRSFPVKTGQQDD